MKTMCFILAALVLTSCDATQAVEVKTFVNARFAVDSRHIYILDRQQRTLATIFRDESSMRVVNHSKHLDAIGSAALDAYADGLLDMAGLAYIGNPPTLSPDFDFEQ